MALDGLRGYAALSVALGHSVLAITGLDLWSKSIGDFSSMSSHEIGYRLLSLVAPSDAAVMLFFVLSGHVLWRSFVRNGMTFLALPQYILSRAMRLFPLIIVTSIIIGILKGASAQEISLTAILWDTSLNSVLWSLQVEVIGSVLLIIVFLWPKSSTYNLVGAFILSCAILPAVRQTPLVYMPAFFLGALIDSVCPVFWRRRVVFWSGLALLIGVNFVLGHGGATRLFEIVGATLVVGCMSASPIAVLQTSLSRFLGAISYPFYLIHPLGAYVASVVVNEVVGMAPLGQIGLFAVISIVVAVPISWLLHVTVEVPAMSWRLPINGPKSNQP